MITNTQRIRIYLGNTEFIPVKILPGSERLHVKHAEEDETLVTFLTTGNLSGPLFTLGEIRSVLKFVQLCCEFVRFNAFTP